VELQLHPLRIDGAPQPGPVDAGWARAISRGERTPAEILAGASRAMDQEDEAERYRADPVAYITAHRPRRLIDRLFGRT